MTDVLLTSLMCAPRSVYSWDIVVTRAGDKLFFDKRDGSNLDYLTVAETAPESVLEEKDNINGVQQLSQEATGVNQAFSQQVCIWTAPALPCPALPCPALPCPALLASSWASCLTCSVLRNQLQANHLLLLSMTILHCAVLCQLVWNSIPTLWSVPMSAVLKQSGRALCKTSSHTHQLGKIPCFCAGPGWQWGEV